MEVTFLNPGVDYMIQQMMAFQAEGESGFWSEPLYHFYPQLDKAYAESLPFPERKNYIGCTLRGAYPQLSRRLTKRCYGMASIGLPARHKSRLLCLMLLLWTVRICLMTCAVMSV